MEDNNNFTVATFQCNSGKINIDHGDGTNLRTLDTPNRRWFRVCGNDDTMVATSFNGICGACVFTRDGEEKQSIVTDQPIASCALNPDGLRLILGSKSGE